MILYFVRHGKPDYATDSLLDEGKIQAEKVAQRLKNCNIDEIHSSPMGRAIETAKPLAALLDKDIIIEPWSYELGKETYTEFPDGNPKSIINVPPSHFLKTENRNMPFDDAFKNIDGINHKGFISRYESIAQGLDEMLLKCGYRRNQDGLYDVIKDNGKHIALFCHCAMTRVMLSHLFNIPYQFFASTMLCHYTGVTALLFEGGTDVIAPRLISYGDIGHLYCDNTPQKLWFNNEIF